jgi:hypothetical protein
MWMGGELRRRLSRSGIRAFFGRTAAYSPPLTFIRTGGPWGPKSEKRGTVMTDVASDPALAGDGAAVGAPLVILKAEGLAVFALATFAYPLAGQSWWLYLILFLFPDLSFLAYTGGNRLGSAVYNALHSYVGPALVGFAGYRTGQPDAVAFALIWTAHIGFDRMLGYGLKYPTGFGHTHLGRKARAEGRAKR